MEEILRTGDIVVQSFALSLLQDAGIEAVVVDTHMNVMEGGIGAFPRRVLVERDRSGQARRVLREGGLGMWLLDA